MKYIMQFKTILTVIIFTLTANVGYGQAYGEGQTIHKDPEFQWPEGKKMALSLTFDDARLSQADNGLPLFDKYGVKATFYLSPGAMLQRVDAWKKAVANGHDMGNHSIVHPCTGNFDWSRKTALEDYTLISMRNELDSASKIIEKELGVKPVSFAYPCGQTFVGKGSSTQSYVSLIATMFESGRGWLDEGPNNPLHCDMPQLTGMELDGKSFDEIRRLIESAKRTGKWLILAGHDINDGGAQTSLISTLDAICKYAMDPANEIWIDNVHNIASYVKSKRGETPFSEAPDYKNPLLSVEQRVQDLLSKMTLKEKVGQLNIPCAYHSELGWGFNSKPDLKGDEYRLKQLEGARRWAEGTHNSIIGPGGGFFTFVNQLAPGDATRKALIMNELQKIAMEKTRLGIPLFQIEEGTHGLMVSGATIFPEGLALGSTWNRNMVKRVFTAVAREGKSIGIHGLCTLVIEPNRDPRMGRNEEGFSEDPFMCSQVAEDIVQAIQGNNISEKDNLVAFLCHYPGQSQPVAGLERGAMEVSERKFREVFLPPWVAGIKKNGALGVMATYPAIDGVAVHSSEWILTDILREELGFEGIVVCEGGGMTTNITERHAANQKEAGILSIKAGVDVGISVEDAYMGSLIESVNEGRIPMELIDRAVARVLRLKFRMGLFENPYVDPDRAINIINSDEHKKLALQAAREGIVLLKNEKNILPLKKNLKTIAVIGPNADAPRHQLGDYHPNNYKNVVSVLAGIKNSVNPNTKINYVMGCDILENKINEISKAVKAAKNADLAIVVLGEDGNSTNGESNDVANLDLTGMQEELLEAVYATGTPVVLVLINGRPLSIRWAAENVPAIVEAWMPGEQGGNAVADILFGNYNPGGKLSITVPRHSGQIPIYYNYTASRTGWDYVDMPASPLFEFGFGLSFTTFEYSNLKIMPAHINTGGKVEVSVDVKNTGRLKGDEIVQLYINDVIASTSRPVKELKGYERISLEPGETKTVTLSLSNEDLSLFDRNMNWVVEQGVFEVMIGSSSEDIRLKGEFEVKDIASN